MLFPWFGNLAASYGDIVFIDECLDFLTLAKGYSWNTTANQEGFGVSGRGLCPQQEPVNAREGHF